MKKIVVRHAQKSLRAGRGERKITGCEQVRFPSLDLFFMFLCCCGVSVSVVRKYITVVKIICQNYNNY